jgi:hypothetical protein
MPDSDQTPVNRARRFRFVCTVVGFCLCAATLFSGGAGMGWLSHQINIVSLFIDGMIGLATAVTLGYVFGSVIDYNGGVRNTLWKPTEAQRRQPPDEEAKG